MGTWILFYKKPAKLLGQGGAMALEDALALADAFKKLGLDEQAWKRFEQLRREKNA